MNRSKAVVRLAAVLAASVLVTLAPQPAGAEPAAPGGRAGSAHDRALRSTDFASSRPDAAVLDRLERKAQRDGTVRVIVGLRLAHTPEGLLTASEIESQRGRLRAAQTSLAGELASSPHRIHSRFRFIPFMALEAGPGALKVLERSPLVASVQEDALEAPDLTQSTTIVESTAAAGAGLSGSGQVIAVLDSGVDGTHGLLSGKVVEEACFSDDFCPNGEDEDTSEGSGTACDSGTSGCDHGTHVAGIAAGKATTRWIYTSSNRFGGGGYLYGEPISGAARGADIMAVQVFSQSTGTTCTNVGRPSPCALSSVSDQIDALERVYELRNQHRFAAVNMSLGGGQNTSTCDSSQSSRKAAVDNLRSAGIVTIASSGNSGFTNALGAPACISTVVSVGNTQKDDTVRSSSNSASFLDLLAPGTDITSSVPGGWMAKSGTSMSAPHVAGAWAVLRSSQPAAKLDRILQVLKETGTDVTDSRNNITKPRINILQAVEALGTVSVEDAGVVSEGNNAAFVVKLSRSYTETVSVSYTTLSGSAKVGYDFQNKSGTLTFQPGERQKTVSVATTSDWMWEGSEYFALKLKSASGANIFDSLGIAHIVG
jgi:subtilisin family serine protease